MSSGITSGRARRALRVGTLTTQVGSSYLWQGLLRPFRSIEGHRRELLDAHVRNALRVVEGSRELRGAFTKLVQMLSMRDDLFPSEALEVLSSVRSSVPPMDYRLIREVVRAELGEPPEHLFRRFEKTAFAAASLGQVHAAELPSRKPVVVKVQYPGVEDTVEQDLENAGFLLETLARIARDVLRQEVDTGDIRLELEERLREELDYRKEAANLALFRRLFESDEEIEIPEVEAELSSRRVLTMSRIEGYPISDVLAPGVDRELKDWLAVKYFRVVWRQLFRFGALHTDPHPGNYFVTYHPRLAILDFGSVRIFPDELRRSYLRLARALVDRDQEQMIDACRALGFLGGGDCAEAMVEVLETVLEPLLVDREYDPGEYHTIDRAIRVATVALERGLYRAPGHRVFLLRALVGLESYVKQLGTVANWRRIFVEEVEAATSPRRSG